MGLEGDFEKLAALGRKLSGVERAAVGEAIAPVLEGQLIDLYQQSFSKQQGPIGGAWAESPNSMFLTGELANPEVRATAREAVVGAPAYYARFHQGGWQTGGERVRMAVATNIRTRKEIKRKARVGGTNAGPARPILPSKNTAGEWDASLRKTIDTGVRDYFAK